MRDDARRRDGLARAYLVEEVRSSLRHSIRNRLSVVRSAAYYIRRKVEGTPLFESDPNVRRFFELIDREVSTSCELLGTSELDDGRAPAAVDPAAAARVALDDVGPPPAVDVSLALDDAPLVAADADDLAVALGCLLENAVEAVEARGGGEVRIEGLPDVEGQVEIAVADQGGGLPEGAEGKLLEPFFTTKPGHHGLGLGVARRIAMRWGGTLHVAPIPGGVRASLRLPRAPNP